MAAPRPRAGAVSLSGGPGNGWLVVPAARWRFDGAMPRDPFVREKFTRERTAAKNLAKEFSSAFRKSVTRPKSRTGATFNPFGGDDYEYVNNREESREFGS
jgi:hypothetical protein